MLNKCSVNEWILCGHAPVSQAQNLCHSFLLLTGPSLTPELWPEMNEPEKAPVLAWWVTDLEADIGSLSLRNSLLFIYYFTYLCVTQNLTLPPIPPHLPPMRASWAAVRPFPKCMPAWARLLLGLPKLAGTSPLLLPDIVGQPTVQCGHCLLF